MTTQDLYNMLTASRRNRTIFGAILAFILIWIIILITETTMNVLRITYTSIEPVASALTQEITEKR